MKKLKFIGLIIFLLSSLLHAEGEFGIIPLDDANQIQTYTGRLTIYWTRVGAAPTDKAIGFIFYPDIAYNINSIFLSDTIFYTGRYYNLVEPYSKMTRNERKNYTQKLAEQYFGKLPDSFLKTQEGLLFRQGSIAINHVSKESVADMNYLSGNLLSFQVADTKILVDKDPFYFSGFLDEQWLSSQDNYIVYAQEGFANIREKPTVQGKVVAKLYNGIKIEKIKTTANGWYLIGIRDEIYDETERLELFLGHMSIQNPLYIHSSQVVIDPRYYVGTGSITAYVKGKEEYKGTTRFHQATKPFYQSPSSKARVIKKLAPYTHLEIIDKITNKDWVQVKLTEADQLYLGFMQAADVAFNAVGVLDNAKLPVNLYAQPNDDVWVEASLAKKNIQLTVIKETVSKNWFYVEILDHEPAYKGYLKREAINFY